jgi:threonine/homoserine/homoserine lactone efflux protein
LLSLDIISYILKGILIGLSVSIPLGPIGILVIQKTLSSGKVRGFITGMGAAFADIVYAIIASLGISIVIDIITKHHIYFQIIGGLFLIYLSAKVFFSNPIKQLRATKGSSNLMGDFLSTFALTISNPMAFFLFLGVFAGIGFLNNDFKPWQSIYIIFGVLIGTSLWWYALSLFISLFRSKIRIRRLNWINKISGIVILAFGIAALVSIFYW